MMKFRLQAAMVALATPLVVAVGAAAPANAQDCRLYTQYTKVVWQFSDDFTASSNCDGVFARYANTYRDRVRGRFYRDGQWERSTIGFVSVPLASDGSANKVIGNTVPGRLCRGESEMWDQGVNYRF